MLILFMVMNATIAAVIQREPEHQNEGVLASFQSFVYKAFYLDKIGNFELDPEEFTKLFALMLVIPLLVFAYVAMVLGLDAAWHLFFDNFMRDDASNSVLEHILKTAENYAW
ncbi:unnamed protein product [Moneuplotes crassus]|uniref:Uncharacterized protein n=1 Tax=Euplotes crassus TaxID=5936 RepID=A0AAD1Y1Y0_EUPCR|nr:unnamed protein product [Moneuplotes crassus]